MLVHMQQVDDGRHQYHAAADAQEAHQHTDDKSQQENNRYHVIGLRYTYRRNGAGEGLPIFPLSRRSRQPRLDKRRFGRMPAFFVCAEPAIFTCLFTPALWSAGPDRVGVTDEGASPKTRLGGPRPDRGHRERGAQRNPCQLTGNPNSSKAISSKSESSAAGMWACRWRCDLPKPDIKLRDLTLTP